MKFSLTLLSVIILLLSCGKIEKKTVKLPVISGYSPRYDQGQINGIQDTTDWTLDKEWGEFETSLFPNYNSFVKSFDASQIKELVLYPNPAPNIAILYQNIKDTSEISYAFKIVNSTFKVLFSSSNKFENQSQTLDINSIKSKSDTLLRLYYIYYKGNKLLYQGHGDIYVKSPNNEL